MYEKLIILISSAYVIPFLFFIAILDKNFSQGIKQETLKIMWYIGTFVLLLSLQYKFRFTTLFMKKDNVKWRLTFKASCKWIPWEKQKPSLSSLKRCHSIFSFQRPIFFQVIIPCSNLLFLSLLTFLYDHTISNNQIVPTYNHS